jgi:hypothetical protein
VVHGQPGVDHGIDEDDVAAFDLRVEVLEKPDPGVPVAVARELDEIEGVVDRGRPREVADEGDAGAQRADEERLAAGVVARELGTELVDPACDLGGVEEDLADARVGRVRPGLRQSAQDAFARPKRTASRSKSRS